MLLTKKWQVQPQPWRGKPRLNLQPPFYPREQHTHLTVHVGRSIYQYFMVLRGPSSMISASLSMTKSASTEISLSPAYVEPYVLST
jgi:hypothetical protein